MSNRFGIPKDIEKEIRNRDIHCVYCHLYMNAHAGKLGTPPDKATIEHLNFDGPFYWKDGLEKEDIVICCGSCNASRGDKRLSAWFQSPYCISKSINENTVSKPVQDYLMRHPGK